MKATKIVLFFHELQYSFYTLIAVPFLLKKDHFSLRAESYKLYHNKVTLISIKEPFAQERLLLYVHVDKKLLWMK